MISISDHIARLATGCFRIQLAGQMLSSLRHRRLAADPNQAIEGRMIDDGLNLTGEPCLCGDRDRRASLTDQPRDGVLESGGHPLPCLPIVYV